MIIADTFHITGRGLVVATDQITSLPVGKKLLATVTRPNGSVLKADAYKEWVLHRNQEPLESEAFLLMGLSKIEIPIGSACRSN